MIQSVKKRYDESENSSDSEIDVDFNQVCLSFFKFFWDVKTDVWQRIEKNVVWEIINSTSIIMKFCMFVVY